ncbi:hypothetical protein PLICRDRAFT_77469, partial [Plicaturopsis crispa FD-325 SS-3]
GDGGGWSVAADWHATSGMTNSLWHLVETTAAVAAATREPNLRERFHGDEYFIPIIDQLLGSRTGSTIKARRHVYKRAQEYMIEDGRLWKVGDKQSRRVPRVECIPSREGFNTALKAHMENGHWDVDITKLWLRDRYFWPHID